jgi:hypothetical protein
MRKCLLFISIVVNVDQSALATVLPVEVGCHEDTCTATFTGAFALQAVDLAIVINLIKEINTMVTWVLRFRKQNNEK